MEPDCRSMVVYGVNGCGKSSFVDAIEYALNDGRIGHLAHEYSGKKQELAVPNTHKPSGMKTEFSIKFCDNSEAKTEIKSDGSTKSSGTISGWEYRRTVLRQDEVIAFIQDTKGDKYSALLPLFGLQQMEVAAENLRQLARNVESLSQAEQRKVELAQVNKRRKASFGADTDEQILKKIEGLHVKYCADKAATADGLSRCSELISAIGVRIAQLSAERSLHVALTGPAQPQLNTHSHALRPANL